MFKKLRQPPQAHSASWITQHFAANCRVCCVNAHIQRRQTFSNHSLKIGFSKTRQGREVAVQKTQTVVIIFEVETFSHSRWQLIDEAESTMVVTCTNSIKQCTSDFCPEGFASIFLDDHLHFETTTHKVDLDFGFIGHQSPLNDVAGHHSIETNDLVARLETCL